MAVRQRSFAERAKELFREQAASFRRSDRFFKMRAGVVAAWVLVAGATLVGACPSSGPANDLGADVRLRADSAVGGAELLVRNESPDLWTELKLTLDGGWRYEQKTMRPQDQVVLSVTQFKKDGQPAPRGFKPRTLTIECEQGSMTTPLR